MFWRIHRDKRSNKRNLIASLEILPFRGLAQKRTAMVVIGENQGLPTDLHDVGMLGDQPKWIEAGGLHQAKGESLSQLGERFMDSVPVCICSRTQHLRSEEHTSELQSLMRISYAVFCLKKKNNEKRQ